MTDHPDRPDIDPGYTARRALTVAHDATERREQKIAETHCLLSIAASLRQLVELQILQNQHLAELARPPEMLEVPARVGLLDCGHCCPPAEVNIETSTFGEAADLSARLRAALHEIKADTRTVTDVEAGQ
jgi:hypothetical protein